MATKQELEAENLRMSGIINQLKTELDEVRASRDTLVSITNNQFESSEKILNFLEEKISTETVVTKIPELGVVEDCVYLNNKQYKIIHSNSVIDFIDDWRKNYVDDESFVVVINK